MGQSFADHTGEISPRGSIDQVDYSNGERYIVLIGLQVPQNK